MPDKREFARTIRIDIPPASPQNGMPAPSARVLKPLTRPRAMAAHSVEFEILLQSIYDAVLICDVQGQVVKSNRRADSFFLCGANDLINTPVIDRIAGADETVIERVVENLENDRHTLIEANCVRSDDSMFPAEIAASNILINGKNHLCFFIRDISLRKEVEQKLEAHNRARLQFVSNVSHELKTPLTSMIYAVGNMLNGVTGDLGAETKQYLELMENNCKRLLGTIEDVLDINRLDSKTIKLHLTRIPIRSLAEKVVDLMKFQAKQKSIMMSFRGGKKALFVDCDSKKIERSLINIVGNAVKFTPGGGMVDVVVAEDSNNPGFVKIDIQDTGKGIPAAAIEKVMTRYYMGEEQASGSGLGLAIAREIVELHGGEITVESPVPGQSQGALFSVKLPTAAAPAVLTAIKDDSDCDEIEKELSAHGFREERADTGTEVINAIRGGGIDLAVVDQRLPEMDGLGLIIQMRSDPELARVPTMVIGDESPNEAAKEILDSFSVHVFTRPLKMDILIDTLENMLF